MAGWGGKKEGGGVCAATEHTRSQQTWAREKSTQGKETSDGKADVDLAEGHVRSGKNKAAERKRLLTNAVWK